MSEYHQYNIFSTLTPLAMKQEAEVTKKTPKNLFHLDVIEGEPFLITTATMSDFSRMNVAETKLFNEISRLSKTDDIFGIGQANDSTLKISFWEAPYLINMVRDINWVMGPGGKKLSFSDAAATLILKINLSETEDKVTCRLCLRSDDKEYDNECRRAGNCREFAG